MKKRNQPGPVIDRFINPGLTTGFDGKQYSNEVFNQNDEIA
jgi:hypothetical protein